MVLLAGFAECGIEFDSPGSVPIGARATKVDGFFPRVKFGKDFDEVLWNEVHIVIDVAEPTRRGGGGGRERGGREGGGERGRW